MPDLSRRRALTTAAALAGAVGVPPALAPSARAAGHRHGSPAGFDEVYRGRRIRGIASAAGAHHGHGPGYAVFVDDVEVLRRDRAAWGVWPRYGVRLRLGAGRHRLVARPGAGGEQRQAEARPA